MTSQKFIRVSDETTNESYELPPEDDNSLPVCVLDSAVSGATGLKFRNPETGAWQFLKLVDGRRIIAPETGWGSITYHAVVKKERSQPVLAAPDAEDVPSSSGESQRAKRDRSTSLQACSDSSAGGQQPASVLYLQNGTNFSCDSKRLKFLQTAGLAEGPRPDRDRIYDDRPSRKPSEGLVNFIKSLRQATIEGDILSLSDDAIIGGEQSLRFLHGKIFVRKCYIELYDILMEVIKKETLLLIKGNPGIGKSFFSYFMIFRLMQQGKTIVWQPFGYEEIVCITPNETRFSPEIVSFTKELNDPLTWYIVDAKVPKNVMATTLVVTSPDADISKPFAKRGVAKRYMPIWDKEEVKKAFDANIPLCRQTDELPWCEIEELFKRWGGIPRYIFQFARDDDEQATLRTAIVAADIDNLCKFIGEPNDDAVSSKLLHLSTKTEYAVGEDESKKFQDVAMVFASEYVREEVVEQMFRRNRDRLMQFLAVGKHEPETAVLRGYLFEGVAHKILSAGGSFTVRKLGKKALSKLVLPRHSRTHSFEKLEDVKQMDQTYYRPLNKKFPAVDSFMFPGQLFQITIAESHPIDADGIEYVVKNVFDAQQPDPAAARAKRKLDEEAAAKAKKAAARKKLTATRRKGAMKKEAEVKEVASPHLDTISSSDESIVVPRSDKEKMNFYFVVPEANFKGFKLQSFKRSRKYVDEASVDVDVVQYALKLAVTSAQVTHANSPTLLPQKRSVGLKRRQQRRKQ